MQVAKKFQCFCVALVVCGIAVSLPRLVSADDEIQAASESEAENSTLQWLLIYANYLRKARSGR